MPIHFHNYRLNVTCGLQSLSQCLRSNRDLIVDENGHVVDSQVAHAVVEQTGRIRRFRAFVCGRFVTWHGTYKNKLSNRRVCSQTVIMNFLWKMLHVDTSFSKSRIHNVVMMLDDPLNTRHIIGVEILNFSAWNCTNTLSSRRIRFQALILCNTTRLRKVEKLKSSSTSRY